MNTMQVLEKMGLETMPTAVKPRIDLTRYQSVNAITRNHNSTSGKYRFISTTEIVDELAKHGWYPSNVQQARVIKEEKRGFQKHLIRFRQDVVNVEIAPEIVLYNSHDATSSIQFSAGIYRFICLNGMVVGDSLTPTFRVLHKGYNVDKINDAMSYMVNQLPQITDTVERFKEIELTPDEQGIFVQTAGTLRYDPEKAIIDPSTLNRAYRSADQGNSLWQVFNRTQENLMKGRIRVSKVIPETGLTDPWSKRKGRKITNVTENIRLNKALWDLTEKMAELKS